MAAAAPPPLPTGGSRGAPQAHYIAAAAAFGGAEPGAAVPRHVTHHAQLPPPQQQQPAASPSKLRRRGGLGFGFGLSGAWRPPRLAARYQIVAACFLATFVAYVERVGFSIAFTEISKAGGGGESLKGQVLSAFYWGYGVSQVRKGLLGLQMRRRLLRERAAAAVFSLGLQLPPGQASAWPEPAMPD